MLVSPRARSACRAPGDAEPERQVMFAEIRSRVEQALSLLAPLIPQLPRILAPRCLPGQTLIRGPRGGNFKIVVANLFSALIPSSRQATLKTKEPPREQAQDPPHAATLTRG
ncbi:transcriptional regulator, XRE family domain protein [Mycobacterium xenopi 4042]|uniref:Transcriptional regulator, XRE family domain protein n=1 Tax=Mycobacterium xenopi 4042 TaxID=1299334 RepID=X8ANC2_MYCXE|nr:transcriptional regulator, XRE family domain protein [Mycobacterium xenopi 4042]